MGAMVYSLLWGNAGFISLKDPKLWELWYIPYFGAMLDLYTLRTLNYGTYGMFLIMGQCRIYIISRRVQNPKPYKP